jgi:hypothetical protein
MSWDLFAWSFAVIRKNKQLLLFPIWSAAVALAGVFLCSQRFLHSHNLGALDYLWLAAGYFLVSFSMIFFNCGLAACANARFKGDEPTLGYGLRHASERLAPILVWTLLSTSVGLILNIVVNCFSGAAKLAMWIFGFGLGHGQLPGYSGSNCGGSRGLWSIPAFRAIGPQNLGRSIGRRDPLRLARRVSLRSVSGFGRNGRERLSYPAARGDSLLRAGGRRA